MSFIKTGILLITIMITISACGFNAAKEKLRDEEEEVEVEVYLNGEKVTMDSPEIINGYPFADITPLTEVMDAQLSWNADESTLAIYYSDKGISFQKNNEYANDNGSALKLPAAPYIKGEKLWVPLVDTFKALDCQVEWNKEEANIRIEVEDLNEEEMTDVTRDVIQSSSSKITGLWSARQDNSGVIVDSAGVPVDYTYYGSWYQFDNNGKVMMITSGSGLVIKGVAVQKGNYKINGSTIEITNLTESFFPAPDSNNRAFRDEALQDKALEFSIDSSSGVTMLYLTDPETAIEDKFYRCD